MPKPPKNLRDFTSLVDIVEILRGPDGCPWDQKQTHGTLAPYTLEEASEFSDALLSGESALIKDEGGDVLLQVVLNAQLLKENQVGNIEDMIESICSKMIRRHPHVFADVKVENADEVHRNWAEIKQTEKATDPLQDVLTVPHSLNGLDRAQKIGSRAKKVNFDWENTLQLYGKVDEEWLELKEAIHEKDEKHIEEELGDLLFVISQLSRHLGLNSEQAIRKANTKFERRFSKMVELSKIDGTPFENLDFAQKEDLWSRVKKGGL